MPVHLDNLGTRTSWFSYLGALGGCLDYLGVDASPAWLAEGTGLAFILSMRADVDVGSPIAWDGLCANASCRSSNPGMVLRLGPNLGYDTENVCACPHGGRREELDRARREAWDLVGQSLAQGVPCLGYELAYPEFFVINGTTDEGYTFLMPGPDGAPATEAGPKAWQELGAEIGWVRVQAVRRGPSVPEEVVVREALRAAVCQMTERPPEGDFVPGLVGYDLWAAALERGEAEGFGHRYNAATWAELRSHATAFLRAAKERLPGRADGLLDAVAGHYAVVADRLRAVSDLHPFIDVQGERIRSEEAAGLIRSAAASEREGFALLPRIVDALA